MHRVQSLPQDTQAVPAFRILSFCASPSVLRALTSCNCTVGEAHSNPSGKVHQTLRYPQWLPCFHPARGAAKSSPKPGAGKPPSPPSWAALLLQWATADLVYLQQKWHKDTGSREHLLQLEKEQDQHWRSRDPVIYVRDMTVLISHEFDKPRLISLSTD